MYSFQEYRWVTVLQEGTEAAFISLFREAGKWSTNCYRTSDEVSDSCVRAM